MEWVQGKILDFINTTKRLACGTRTIQNSITNYTSIWKEDNKRYGESRRRMQKDGQFFHSEEKEEEN
jgi:hypothetical protein